MGDVGLPHHRHRRVASSYPQLLVLTIPCVNGPFVTAASSDAQAKREIERHGGPATIVDLWERSGAPNGPFGGWLHLDQFRL